MDEGRGTHLGMGVPDANAPAWPAARPEDLSPAERAELSRRPTTGSGHVAVRQSAGPEEEDEVAAPEARQPSAAELERELGEELDQLYRSALESMDDPLPKK